MGLRKAQELCLRTTLIVMRGSRDMDKELVRGDVRG